MTLAAATAAGALALLSAATGTAGATPPNPPPAYVVHHGPDGNTDVNVCSYNVPAGSARCFARVRTDEKARSERPSGNGGGPSATLGNSGAYDPPYLESAYNDPWFIGSSTKSTVGTGQTVAIVDAYDDPNAESDMGSYRSFFGLSSCTTQNGCFKKVNEFGGTSYPVGNTGWGQEISLDLDMVSAMCPNCHILLVEARTSSIADLGTAVNEAVSLGANAVSNSYGGGEYPGEGTDSGTYYDHPGVAVVVASGDNGYGVSFPAASPTVTDAGGTSLNQATNTGSRSATETVWSGAGSGCSAYESKPSWQTDTSGCPNRTVADSSAVADPNTGVWVYDTYGGGTWNIFGGTSVATPIVSSFYALAQNPTGSSSLPASYLYGHIPNLNQVKSGSNGNCGSYLCNAADSLLNGYNGPTGLGTPNGVAAFSAAPTAPGPPGAPTGVTALPANASAEVSFSAPNANGSPITSYAVTAADSTTSSNGGQIVSGAASPITVSGLTNGDSYTFTVTATNAKGTGPASAPSAPVVPYTLPGAPTGVSATAGPADATVSFGAAPANGSAITSYTVTAADSTTSANGGQVASGPSSPISVTGLTAGDSYTFTVTATNAAGTGPASSPSNAVVPLAGATVPGTPTNVSARSDTFRGTDVSWTAPSNGGSAITSYTVYRSTRSGGETTYASYSCTTSSCTFHDGNTRRGTVYYYKVAAVNAVGTGPKSTEVHATAR